MGWDAFAVNPDGSELERNWQRDAAHRPELVDPALKTAFEAAADKAKAAAGHVDWLLPLGGLDVSHCGRMLEAAAKIDAWGDDLTPAQVKAAWERAFWAVHLPPSPYERETLSAEDELIYRCSAREFLRVCAEQGLGIEFSW
jgi:hypothetical protein